MCEYCGCQAIGAIRELTQEHDAALEDVRRGREAATTGDRRAAATVARRLHVLREHIAKEQDGLFPAAVTSLGPDDWEAVEQVRARVGSTLRSAAVPAGEGRSVLVSPVRPS